MLKIIINTLVKIRVIPLQNFFPQTGKMYLCAKRCREKRAVEHFLTAAMIGGKGFVFCF